MLHKSEKCFRQGTLRSISTESIIDLLVILSSSNSYSVSQPVNYLLQFKTRRKKGKINSRMKSNRNIIHISHEFQLSGQNCEGPNGSLEITSRFFIDIEL